MKYHYDVPAYSLIDMECDIQKYLDANISSYRYRCICDMLCQIGYTIYTVKGKHLLVRND
jgi:hypothetical protein